MKPIRTVLIAAAGTCLAFAGLAQADPPPKKPADDAAVRKALRTRLITLHVSEAKLNDVLRLLGGQAGCKIEVDWAEVTKAKVKLAAETPVRLKAEHIPVAAALRKVLDSAAGAGALDFVVEQGRVLILPKAVVDSRFISRLDADLKAVNAGATKATSLVKQLLKARAGLPATRGRVAALERQLRRTAGPVLRQIDRKVLELGEVAAQLIMGGLGPTDPRRKAVAERLNVLVAALETIAGAGAWEPVPPPPAGKRRLLFRPDKTSRTYARPRPATATSKPRGKWTAEKGKVVLKGKSAQVTFHPDAPAAGDVELRTTLSFEGGNISNITILLFFGPPGKVQSLYTCGVLRHGRPDWCRLFCRGHSSRSSLAPFVLVRLPALKEGKAYPLRMLIRGRKLTCSFANRTASVDGDPLPAGANLKYVELRAGRVGGTVTLDDFKITCAAGAADKPKDVPKPAKPATKATPEQERQAANLLKLADANRKIRLKKTAIEFYERIVKEYPATAAVKEAKYWLTILRR